MVGYFDLLRVGSVFNYWDIPVFGTVMGSHAGEKNTGRNDANLNGVKCCRRGGTILKTANAILIGLLCAVGVAIASVYFRYSIVPMNSTGTVYKLDRWTGKAYAISGDYVTELDTISLGNGKGSALLQRIRRQYPDAATNIDN
jgi:hypothetical protein